MPTAEPITSATVALSECEDLFSSDPIGCNLVATVLRPGTPTAVTRVADDTGRTIGVTVEWPPGVTLTRLDPAALDTVADSLDDGDGWLWGSALDVLEVSRRWCDRTGGAVDLDELMRVLTLRRPPTVGPGPGELHRVDPTNADSIDRAAHWARAFGVDVDHARTDVHADAVAQMHRAASEHRIFTWSVDGGVVAHLLVSLARFGVVRIGGVYTPPEHRGRGHASSLTSAVSATLLELDDVHTVMLNTQAVNASTNRLYRRLGYTHDFDALSVRLRTAVTA